MMDEEDGPKRKPRWNLLRQRRRPPIHPDKVYKMLCQRALQDVAQRGPTPYGWLVILFPEDRRSVVRTTHENATYQEAKQLLEKEMRWTGKCDAWIIAKQVAGQKTVRP